MDCSSPNYWQKQIDELQAEIDELQAEVETLHERLRKRDIVLANQALKLEELSAMLGAIDMSDLAPVTSFDGCGRWDPAHYCCESLHEHPTVPQFLGELKHRVREEAPHA